MILFLALSAILTIGLAVRRYTTPACPRCKHRVWDRKLCAPLLLCQRCSTRIDSAGRAYN